MDVSPPEALSRLAGSGLEAVGVMADVELALRMAAQRGVVRYVPGSPGFEAIGPLSQAQGMALERIRGLLARRPAGVQECLQRAVFGLLGRIVVYPVEDEARFTDSKGRVLPDAFLVPAGSTPRDLARAVHTDLAEGFLYGVDARRRTRLGEKYVLKSNDVVRIVSSR